MGLMIVGAGMDHSLVLCASRSRNDTLYSGAGDRMGILYHKLCTSYRRYIPTVFVHRTQGNTTIRIRYVEVKLWNVFDAHLLAGYVDLYH